jgi:hypothetical protein
VIGVAITTRNRPSVLAESLTVWREFLPDGAVLVVVDDASSLPVTSTFRFDENVGVAAAKNKSLALLVERGVTEFFLADDDCWPASADWWEPYVESPVPHLRYSWGGRVIESRDGWVSTTGRHGCLMYANQVVLDRVGGFRPEFTGFGWEHVEWFRRIHAAGLTPHRYVDVVNSDRLWVSLDRIAKSGGPAHSSSVGANRRALVAAARPVLERFLDSTDYVEFR